MEAGTKLFSAAAGPRSPSPGFWAWPEPVAAIQSARQVPAATRVLLALRLILLAISHLRRLKETVVCAPNRDVLCPAAISYWVPTQKRWGRRIRRAQFCRMARWKVFKSQSISFE